MKIVVDNTESPVRQTTSIRALYRAIGKGHLCDYEMRRARAAAANYRERVDGKKRPGGLGEPMLTLPDVVVAHFREAHMDLYLNDKPKFWCTLWHRFPDYRCRSGVCPACGRS